MDEEEYRLIVRQAKKLLILHPDYINGYLRGLRRYHYGPHFGSLHEHEAWMAFAYDRYPFGTDRGRGYLDGLQGITPKVPAHIRRAYSL